MSSINLEAPLAGHALLTQGDCSIGLLFGRWFYLREGETAIARLREWVYMREGDHWIARLGRLWLSSERGQLRLRWRA